jgi:hypothetical protein
VREGQLIDNIRISIIWPLIIAVFGHSGYQESQINQIDVSDQLHAFQGSNKGKFMDSWGLFLVP